MVTDAVFDGINNASLRPCEAVNGDLSLGFPPGPVMQS